MPGTSHDAQEAVWYQGLNWSEVPVISVLFSWPLSAFFFSVQTWSWLTKAIYHLIP